jgi:hypothetical protein
MIRCHANMLTETSAAKQPRFYSWMRYLETVFNKASNILFQLVVPKMCFNNSLSSNGLLCHNILLSFINTSIRNESYCRRCRSNPPRKSHSGTWCTPKEKSTRKKSGESGGHDRDMLTYEYRVILNYCRVFHCLPFLTGNTKINCLRNKEVVECLTCSSFCSVGYINHKPSWLTLSSCVCNFILFFPFWKW